MNPAQLAVEIERIILSSTDKYASQVDELQIFIYNRLVRILKDLELDPDGYIKQTASNRNILRDAENALDELLPGEDFTLVVSKTLQSIAVLDKVNSDYFVSIADSFNENRNFVKSLQAQTIEGIETTLLQDGLTVQIKFPLTEILNRNVNSGGQFSGFLEEIRNFIRGNTELDGRLLSYSRTYLTDTLFNYSRSYQESMTADLRLDWYLYSGGLTDTSREFCVDRAGKYFHRKEIEQWPSLSWQGKRRGTTKSSIFTFLAGHNCRHSLVPVSTTIVPKEDLERLALI